MKIQSNYKYKTIVSAIKQKIAENYGKGIVNIPTEAALCEQFGVSRVSVRKALKVLEEEGLIERKQGSGTRVSSKLTAEDIKEIADQAKNKKLIRIGIIVPELASEYMLNLLSSIQSWTANNGYNNVVFEYGISRHNEETESRIIENMLESGIDGLLIYPIDGQYYSKNLLELSLNNFPVVIIDRILPGLNFTFVSGNNKKSFAQAVKTMCEYGHEKIAFFSATPKPTSAAKEGLIGYEDGLKAQGIKIDAQLEIIADKINKHPLTEDDLQKSYAETLEQLTALLASGKVSAVLCDCTTSSILVMRLLRSDNPSLTEVKNNIAVLYCDMDYSVLNNASPAPSCIKNDYIGIGENSIKLLFERLSDENAPRKTIKVPFIFIKGETLFSKNNQV